MTAGEEANLCLMFKGCAAGIQFHLLNLRAINENI